VVHAAAAARSASEFRFSTTELPAGSRDATDAVFEERVFGSTDQIRDAMAELERRLAMQGRYYRADTRDMRWLPLGAPGADALPSLDLRAHEFALPDAPGSKLRIHHFHAQERDRDALLVAMPRADLGGARTILAQVDFDFPLVEKGDVTVLHTRLAAPTLASQLVRRHVELPTLGYAKLVEPHDYARAFGARWLDRTRETFRLAAGRVFRLGREEAPAPPKLEERPRVEAEALREALHSDRVRRLRARVLTPEETRAALAGGELGIRRHVQTRMRRADHHEAFDLSVIQSVLLVEYGLATGMQALLDEEGAKVLRFVAGARAKG
jgi:hypothetical protein